jgi:hypothetical protein
MARRLMAAGAAEPQLACSATALLHLLEPILVVGLHLLHLLLELLVAILELLELAGQHRERLLQLVESILDIDRIQALGRGRGRRGQGDRQQQMGETGAERLHGGDSVSSNAAIFRHGRPASQRKRRSRGTGVIENLCTARGCGAFTAAR